MPTDASNQTFTTSKPSSDLLPAWECTPWIVLLVLECLAIVILNVITIIVFLTQRPLQRRCIYSLIRHLAMVDLLTGAISGPLQVERRLGEYCDVWEYNNAHTWGFLVKFALLHLFSFASLANLAAISLERVHATFRPVSHVLANKRVYYILVVVIWLTSVIREAIQILFFKMPEDYVTEELINSTLYITYYLISLLIICASYISILIKMRFSPHVNSTNNGTIIKERRLTSTLFSASVASLLSLLPAIIFLSVKTFRYESIVKLSSSSRYHLSMVVTTLFLANSLANPIIYSMRMQGFRSGLANLFRNTPTNGNGVALPLPQL